MGVPTHIKISFRGEFVGTPEEWSFGLHFSRDNTLNDDAGVDDIDVQAVTDAFAGLIGGGGSASFPTVVKATEWRAYVIGTDNKMEGNPLLVDIRDQGIVGVSSLRLPPQNTVVVTFVAANRGPARFGRIFLPPPGVAVANDLRMSVGDAAAIREAVTTFTKDVSDAIDLEDTASSELLNISERPAPNGSKQTVDHLEVGRVVDTMRSRRRSLVEERNVGGQIDW